MQKKKRLSYILLSAAFLLILVLMIVGGILYSRTYFNEPGVLGNTAGNLYNGGLFCEYDDKIYFSNFNDDGTLYQMDAADCSKMRKVYDDRICYLNADEHYLYYSRINNQKKEGSASIFTFYNTGIYRLPKKKTGRIKLLYNNPSGLLLLYGNHIYYQHYKAEEGLSLYRVKIDATDETRLSDEALLPACVDNGNLLYSGVLEDRNLHTLNPETREINTLLEQSTYFPIATTDGYYYISLTDYSIRRFDAVNNTVTKLVADPCATYNISQDGRYLYYQIDRTKQNRICVMDLSTGTETTILEGNYKQIHVTKNFVFFTAFDDTATYAYTTDGNGILSTFHPTVDK